MKIGFFDSGLGGTTVLKEALLTVPANYCYLADTKHTPYGTKPKEEVLSYIFSDIEYLVREGCQIIVIACNTATSIAIDALRKKYPSVIIIGTEPAVKVALDHKPERKILVCATSITVRENKLYQLIDTLDATDRVDLVALDGLVPLIESRQMNHELVEEYLRNSLLPYDTNEYEYVVLGCTHFPIVKEDFKKVFPSHTKLVEGSAGIVNNLKKKLELLLVEDKNSIMEEKTTITLILTKESQCFVTRYKELLNLTEVEIRIIGNTK